ncbi:hypothetical protein M378DRAFT_76963 [Amanita muscaria Koide BX008]|uniref:Uncharacterized protein n=1 Tax=Amanita muscaria (strain Koide BX008) TaxID=946122 RepID=A0A0C2X8A5_AMAMK|nr:hypothetical protein M378DRAFT_76963 [Amanita muscaria Koide BX008]
MVEPRHITAEELRLFRDPENLHGKQFVLSANNDSGIGTGWLNTMCSSTIVGTLSW